MGRDVFSLLTSHLDSTSILSFSIFLVHYIPTHEIDTYDSKYFAFQ